MNQVCDLIAPFHQQLREREDGEGKIEMGDEEEDGRGSRFPAFLSILQDLYTRFHLYSLYNVSFSSCSLEGVSKIVSKKQFCFFLASILLEGDVLSTSEELAFCELIRASDDLSPLLQTTHQPLHLAAREIGSKKYWARRFYSFFRSISELKSANNDWVDFREGT